MKLRTFILLISISVIGLIVGVLHYQAQDALNTGFDQIGAAQVESISRYVRAIIKSKREYLENFRRLISADAEVAKAMAFSESSGDEYWIYSKLNDIKRRSKFDVVGVVYPDGSSTAGYERSVARSIYRCAVEHKEDFLITSLGGKITLLSLAPSEAKGTDGGILVLGYYLDGSFEKRVAELTGSSIAFSLRDRDELAMASRHGTTSTDEVFEIHECHQGVLFARITLDRTVIDRIGSGINQRLLLSGLESLLLLLGFLYALLELGFVRRFKSILGGINQASAKLDQGEITEVPVVRHPIQEIYSLSSAFNKFSTGIRSYDEKIKEQTFRSAEIQKQAALAMMAQQTAHDIRSPLTALDMFLETVSELPETTRSMMRGCITRIKDVANGLLEKGRESTETTSSHLISLLIEPIVSEKRVQLKPGQETEIKCSLGPEHYGLFIEVNPKDFSRAISNLLDNAVEALDGKGLVSIDVTASEKTVTVAIHDNGKGIPKNILPQLGERGRSFGKAGGSGLGLFFAKQKVEAWGGTVTLESREGEGTSVVIELPRVAAPNWFVPRLLLPDNCAVAVLDDDPSIHQLWEERFRALGAAQRNIRIIHLFGATGSRSVDELDKATLQETISVFLCDYELLQSSTVTGLDVIKKFNLQDRAILVTSHSEEPTVQQACAEQGIRIIPKEFAGRVPILWLSDLHRVKEAK